MFEYVDSGTLGDPLATKKSRHYVRFSTKQHKINVDCRSLAVSLTTCLYACLPCFISERRTLRARACFVFSSLHLSKQQTCTTALQPTRTKYVDRRMDDEPLTTNQPAAFTNSFYDGLVASNSRLTFKSKSTSLPCLRRTDLFVCKWLYVRTSRLYVCTPTQQHRINVDCRTLADLLTTKSVCLSALLPKRCCWPIDKQSLKIPRTNILVCTYNARLKCTYFPDAFHLVCTYKRATTALQLLHPVKQTNPVKLDRILTGERGCLGQSNLACLVVVAKLEAENETQKCSMFYIFISSVQLKSLVQTNLLVHRREFTSSLLCLTCTKGPLTSKPRLTIKLDNLYFALRTDGRTCLCVDDALDGPTWPACVRACVCTYVLTCLPFPERNLTGKRRRLSLWIIHGRLTIKLDNLTSNTHYFFTTYITARSRTQCMNAIVFLYRAVPLLLYYIRVLCTRNARSYYLTLATAQITSLSVCLCCWPAAVSCSSWLMDYYVVALLRYTVLDQKN